MKILMQCYEFPPLGGGASRVVFGLSRELVRLGHNVDLVTMKYRGLPRIEDVDGVQVHRVPCVRLKKYLCTVPEAATYLLASVPIVRKLVRRERYDIQHAHFILPDGFTAWSVRKIAKLPYVVTAHGSDVPGYNPDRLQFSHKMLAPVWRQITREAACIVCPSPSIESLIHRCNNALETRLIPYGFEVGRYAQTPVRNKWILVVTRMLHRKGVQHLLEAYDGLETEHELHIVGDGPYLPTLRKMATKIKGRITFHGWLDNRSEVLNRLYEGSDIFVLPSEAENFPVALMEAMAAELAIVTSRGTGCEAVVGDSAVLVEPGKSAEIRSMLQALTRDPDRCRRLGRAARRRIESHFSWSAVGQEYVELYHRLIEGNLSELRQVLQ